MDPPSPRPSSTELRARARLRAAERWREMEVLKQRMDERDAEYEYEAEQAARRERRRRPTRRRATVNPGQTPPPRKTTRLEEPEEVHLQPPRKIARLEEPEEFRLPPPRTFARFEEPDEFHLPPPRFPALHQQPPTPSPRLTRAPTPPRPEQRRPEHHSRYIGEKGVVVNRDEYEQLWRRRRDEMRAALERRMPDPSVMSQPATAPRNPRGARHQPAWAPHEETLSPTVWAAKWEAYRELAGHDVEQGPQAGRESKNVKYYTHLPQPPTRSYTERVGGWFRRTFSRQERERHRAEGAYVAQEQRRGSQESWASRESRESRKKSSQR